MTTDETYLLPAELTEGVVYELNSRNLKFGVWVADVQGFIGVRKKFNSKFLFTEYHYDTSGNLGTVKPLKSMGLTVPNGIELHVGDEKLFEFLKQVEFDNRQNDIVIGLNFGDEGKGTIVDFLASQRNTNYVVRFSGGAQAAHNVVTEDGQHHTFSQFGSATFRNVKTILSNKMMVNPFNMVPEAAHLESLTGVDPFTLTFVSENCLLTTPYHQQVNRLREIARGGSAHGSCGEGVGETMHYKLTYGDDAPRIKDLLNPDVLIQKLQTYYNRLNTEFDNLADYVPSVTDLVEGYQNFVEDINFNIVSDEWIYSELRKGYNIFEGSQGVLLDENYGFHPHTTWSTVTDHYAQKMLGHAGLEEGHVFGITRSYTTRHGNGPFPSEFANTGWETTYPEHHNGEGQFQGKWRAGLLDIPLLKHGIRMCSVVDTLVVTHLDIPTTQVVTKYDTFGEETSKLFKHEHRTSGLRKIQQQTTDILLSDATKNSAEIQNISSESELIALLEKETGVKVGLKSYSPTSAGKIRV